MARWTRATAEGRGVQSGGGDGASGWTFPNTLIFQYTMSHCFQLGFLQFLLVISWRGYINFLFIFFCGKNGSNKPFDCKLPSSISFVLAVSKCYFRSSTLRFFKILSSVEKITVQLIQSVNMQYTIYAACSTRISSGSPNIIFMPIV